MTLKSPVLVVYGGESSEHEVSRRSASFVLHNIDFGKFAVGVVGITQTGSWYFQDLDTLKASEPGKELPLSEKSPVFGPSTKYDDSSKPGASIVGYMESLCERALLPNEICVFPITHGTHGEDGHLQGYLELSGFSFVGSDTLGSSVAMDKHISKLLVSSAGIPIVPYKVVRKTAWQKDREAFLAGIYEELGPVLFVKPASLGSSVGILKVTQESELCGAIDHAFEYDEKILVETGLDIREIECAALGHYEPSMSKPGEVNATGSFYSYEAKYLDPDGAVIKVPADLDTETEAKVRDLSKMVFEVLCLYGMARVDWFLEKSTGRFYFNEVNTLPGMTPISQYPILWKCSGVGSSELISELIETGYHRGRLRALLKRSV